LKIWLKAKRRQWRQLAFLGHARLLKPFWNAKNLSDKRQWCLPVKAVESVNFHGFFTSFGFWINYYNKDLIFPRELAIVAELKERRQ